MTIEIQVRNADLWVDEVLDQGFAVAVDEDDVDGHGDRKGIVSSGDDANAAAWTGPEIERLDDAGIPLRRTLTDSHGRPLNEPVLLNGAGGLGTKVDLGGKTVPFAYWIHYLTYETADHKDLFNASGGPFSLRI